MGVTVLGPIELTRESDGSSVPLGGRQRRAVLALLALELGCVVPVPRFYELLWGEQVPVHADAVLQGHIAALRKALPGTGLLIETRSAGYRMSGPAAAVDHARFLTLLEGGDGRFADRRLSAALGLWRGPALAGLSGTDLQRRLAAELDELHAQTLERWARVQLAASNAAAAVPALEAAVHAEPLREPLVALLLRCLHQAGSVTKAADLYDRTRKRLAEELGMDPGEELRAVEPLLSTDGGGGAETARRARDPRPGASGAVPQMLPPDVWTLGGRADEIARIDRACRPGQGGPGRIVVTGPAGVGKSAAVVHWAHAAAPDFPDGTLYANLRGFGAGPVLDPAEVLVGFLEALGVPVDSPRDDPAWLAALYQVTVSPLRLLVVLDDAADAEQVRPLIPEGAGCATVVTGRGGLERLSVAVSAPALVFTGLQTPAAVLVLEQYVGTARVAAEPDAAERIAGYCEGLPLALRLCGARLALRPTWTLADAVRELADEQTRLSALDVDGSERLLHELHRTRARLSPAAFRLLALLGMHAGAAVDAGCSAALLGVDVPSARRALDDLAAYHLTDETAPGRHERGSLVRSYCARLLDQEVPPQERHAALERMLRQGADGRPGDV